jgi:hypothetical protein
MHARDDECPGRAAWAFVILLVEVAGIEPASDGEGPGLLRAQPAMAVLSPGDHTGKSPSRAQSLFSVPSGPATGPSGSGLLADVSYRAEGTPGLTDHRARSGGEGEVGALCVGTYWFATRIYEITSPTRPASPGTTSTVETCHPRDGPTPGKARNCRELPCRKRRSTIFCCQPSMQPRSATPLLAGAFPRRRDKPQEICRMRRLSPDRSQQHPPIRHSAARIHPATPIRTCPATSIPPNLWR